MIEKNSKESWKADSPSDLATRYLVPYDHCKVQVLDFKKGYQIPRHSHVGQALHVIVKGKLQLDDGSILDAMSDYKCGGWEYRGTALEDTLILVVEPN